MINLYCKLSSENVKWIDCEKKTICIVKRMNRFSWTLAFKTEYIWVHPIEKISRIVIFDWDSQSNITTFTNNSTPPRTMSWAVSILNPISVSVRHSYVPACRKLTLSEDSSHDPCFVSRFEFTEIVGKLFETCTPLYTVLAPCPPEPTGLNNHCTDKIFLSGSWKLHVIQKVLFMVTARFLGPVTSKHWIIYKYICSISGSKIKVWN